MQLSRNLNPGSVFFRLLSLSSKSFSALSSSSPSPIITDFLVQKCGFSQTLAKSISSRFSWAKSPENPQSVVHFLQSVGFSESDVRSSVRAAPQILFCNIDKTLKPKLQLFQELGFVGSELGKFVSKYPTVLTFSLEKRLVPCIEILRKKLSDDENNRDLIVVLRRCGWIAYAKPESLLYNVEFLERCGIVGSQLAILLKRQPRLFLQKESSLKELVSRAVDMGFAIDSRMLVHALYTMSCLNDKTIREKQELFHSFGFSEEECMEMFRRAPALPRVSKEKLKLGIEFLMNTIKFEKSLLVHRPTILMHSMVGRVIPRCRVLQILKSKRLLKKDPSFLNVLGLTEGEFLEKFVWGFSGNTEELLLAYKGHLWIQWRNKNLNAGR